MNLVEKLLVIQCKLKAPKNQYNSFGKYNYRNCEDILEAVKPLLLETKTALTVADTVEYIGDRYYIKATATLHDTEGKETITNTAYAREDEKQSGMAASQVTGSTSSYARKYCLNGLFSLDDTKDADSYDNTQKAPKNDAHDATEYKCEDCGKLFAEFEWKGKHYTEKDAYEIAKKKCNGKALCNACKKKAGF